MASSMTWRTVPMHLRRICILLFWRKYLPLHFKDKHASSFPFFVSLETPCWNFININLILLQLFNKDWFEMQPNSINKVTNSSKEKKLTLNIHQAQSRGWKGRTHKWLPTNAQSSLLGLITPSLTVLNWGHYFSFQTDVAKPCASWVFLC